MALEARRVSSCRSTPEGDDAAGCPATAPSTHASRSPSPEARLAPYRDAGLQVLLVGRDPQGRLDLPEALRALGGLGLTRVLVEGGGRLAAGLLKAGLVDELHWFRAPKIIGGDGRPAVADLGLEALAAGPGFARVGLEILGADLLETFRRSA